MRYNWQEADWPQFRYEPAAFADLLIASAEQSGRLSGLWAVLTREGQADAELERMTTEAQRTSEIEGENLDRAEVMSSIRNQLGLNSVPVRVRDRRAEGIAALLVSMRASRHEALSEEQLFHWHRLLMQGSPGVQAGCWRTHSEPMQIISGGIDDVLVHFEAPPSGNVPGEMRRYIDWYNHTAPGGPAALPHSAIRAAAAHLYFESIHPFEDGNGRMGRALAEKVLAQGSQSPGLFSLSDAILTNRRAYYDALKQAQRSNEITDWITWFLGILIAAQGKEADKIAFTLQKTQFLDRVGPQLNPRQRKGIERMLEAGPDGFAGGMTTRKYIAITRTSKATATRDLQELADQHILTPAGAGRSVHYLLHFDG
jgi:Fic family protein